MVYVIRKLMNPVIQRKGETERGRHRERETQREGDTEREGERERETDRERERDRDRERKRVVGRYGQQCLCICVPSHGVIVLDLFHRHQHHITLWDDLRKAAKSADGTLHHLGDHLRHR